MQQASIEHPDPRLDVTDRHLLTLLQANAREPVALLARKLGLARTTVVARIARLEKNGIIAGYGVRLGQTLEENVVRSYCFISVRPKTGAQVAAALKRLPEVEELSAVSGVFDYLALLRCSRVEQLDALLDQIGLVEGVNHTQSSIVLSRKIDRRAALGQ
ncbi:MULTISPECIES: Lrp/AsnC family transcriptional regulator [unclassified Achromobacter]|uniref:Lrp/AsnC family transcriptional regulator n=1 Tax=unclassified Achromobacter TaxID=2626865 RepID=UPI000B518DFC|nr:MULTISPECIES: Lrp/AsnC family transcriptional regulator [unclassified Achromobacter]OWT71504.1 AsnC family transcriptional regulator [Achromobacter sp. HZ34]OWT73161.1 AsnC family transcriptional regulator [Achromobacter sp. HZ28]